MTPATIKTLLGALIAVATVAHLLFVRTGEYSTAEAIVYGAFLLFAGVLIDPETFKGLAFWRRSE